MYGRLPSMLRRSVDALFLARIGTLIGSTRTGLTTVLRTSPFGPIPPLNQDAVNDGTQKAAAPRLAAIALYLDPT